MDSYPIPARPLFSSFEMAGPFQARPIGLSQGTTKKLCLCDLQRKKDAERVGKAKPQRGT